MCLLVGRGVGLVNLLSLVHKSRLSRMKLKVIHLSLLLLKDSMLALPKTIPGGTGWNSAIAGFLHIFHIYLPPCKLSYLLYSDQNPQTSDNVVWINLGFPWPNTTIVHKSLISVACPQPPVPVQPQCLTGYKFPLYVYFFSFLICLCLNVVLEVEEIKKKELIKFSNHSIRLIHWNVDKHQAWW